MCNKNLGSKGTKKVLFTLCCLFVFFISNRVSAQRFTAGIIGGLSTSQISGDGLAGFHQFGACVGGMAALSFNEKWSTQFEILFIQKGSHTVSSDTLANGSAHLYSLRLNYLEVPILLNYHYKKFIFEAGPSIAVLLSSKEEDIFGDVSYAEPFKRTDLSFNLGITYPIYKMLMLNIRFSNSLMYVRNTPALSYEFYSGGQYSSVVQFTFRYYMYSDKEK